MILNDDGPLLLLLCTKRKPGERQNDIQFVTQVQNRPRTNKINNMLGILVVSAQDSCHIQRCNQSRQDKSESRKHNNKIEKTKKGKEYICSVCIQKHTKFAKHVQNSPAVHKQNKAYPKIQTRQARKQQAKR